MSASSLVKSPLFSEKPYGAILSRLNRWRKLRLHSHTRNRTQEGSRRLCARIYLFWNAGQSAEAGSNQRKAERAKKQYVTAEHRLCGCLCSASVCGQPRRSLRFSIGRSEDWMQRLAQETNIPATVFVTPAETDYAIRWFTPMKELPLCGHGTLAAHTLWTEDYAPASQPLRFLYKGGVLTAARHGAWIRMDFPSILT